MDGIRGVTAPPWNVADFNDAMAGTATEVYGPTATVVDECARTGERTPPPPYAPRPAWLAPDPRHLRDREMFW